MSDANAPLTATGRLRLTRCVVEDDWLPRRAAKRFGVSVTTVRKWVYRYRAAGVGGGELDEGQFPAGGDLAFDEAA